MAKYLLANGYKTKPTADESAELTRHNDEYMEITDCEEVIRAFFRPPFEGEKCRALSAGVLMQMMRIRGFSGKGYSSIELGRSLRRIGYQPHIIKGAVKYLIVEKDTEALKTEEASDALTILHDIQSSSDAVGDNDGEKVVEPF
jgi:hypothetical protein